jgi:hypothetical protein
MQRPAVDADLPSSVGIAFILSTTARPSAFAAATPISAIVFK